MPTLYDFAPSGNGYKVRMLLRRLDLPFKYREVDITKGETRTAAFLKKNPNGRIPLFELDDGRALAESDAILFFLAEGTPYLPDDKWGRAEVLQWMFFEQYNHEPTIAVSRAILHVFPNDKARRAELPGLQQKGHAALEVLEGGLSGPDYLVGNRPSIADLALYAYTHVADEGGFDLNRYPNIRAWLARVAAHPKHIRISQTKF
jgi:glutathione S-transferase